MKIAPISVHPVPAQITECNNIHAITLLGFVKRKEQRSLNVIYYIIYRIKYTWKLFGSTDHRCGRPKKPPMSVIMEQHLYIYKAILANAE